MNAPSLTTERVQALLRSGALVEAGRLAEHARVQAPTDVDALRACAYARFAAGLVEEAILHMAAAVQHSGADPAVLQEQAELLASAGRPIDAIAVLRQAIEVQPTAARWFLLGRLLYGTQRENDAVDAFRTVVALEPDSIAARRALAECLFAAERYVEAGNVLETLGPDTLDEPASQVRLVEIAARTGDVSGALERLERLEHGMGPSAGGAQLRGRLFEDAGDAEAAGRAYGEAARLAPDWAQPLGALLMLEHRNPSASLLQAVEQRIAAPGLDRLDAALLHYALGKAADASGQWQRAWEHWRQANMLQRTGSPQEPPDALPNRVQALVSRYTPTVVQRMRSAARADSRPVLVVGMPRSGTTLVERVLAAHPDVAAAGELPTLAQMHMEVEAILESGREPDVAALADRYLRELEHRAGRQAGRIVDKQPYNFMFLGLAAGLLPGMHLIWCRRDPKDVAVSIYGESFATRARYATSLAEIKALGEACDSLMVHWQRTLGLNVHEVRYEALVSDFDDGARRLIGAVGLPWHDACLDFHNAPGHVQTNSRWQVRAPVHGRSVGRWRTYASHLASAGYDIDA